MVIRFTATSVALSLLLATTATAQTAAPAKSTTAPAEPPRPIAPALKSAESTYKVSPGDVVDIYVWGEDKLQRTLTVLPDGTFAFPLAGTVAAAGHTSNEIEKELSRLLAPQFKGDPPQVTVSVKQSSGMQISIIGKVRSPGSFSPPRYVTVLDLLALAGGPNEFADLSNIVVLRTVDGKVQVVHARLGSVLKGKPSDTDLASGAIPQLVGGDTVVVP